MRRSGFVLIAAIAALAFAAPAQAQAQTGLEGHLLALQAIADANGGQRSAGTAGERATAAYIARTLRAAGYRVRRQPFRIARSTLMVVGGRSHGALVMRNSAGGLARGRLRAAGSGCRRADFRRVGAGTIALARRGGCTPRVKARLAARAGASALVVVNSRDRRWRTRLRGPASRIPVVTVAAGDAPRAGRRAWIEIDGGDGRSQNVIADTGPASGTVTMAGGHLDSVPAGPGLNDNASGVATLLHVAERLAGRGLSLRFGFWGAEELGMLGSEAYVRRLARAERRRIGGYINLDMVGSPRGTHAVYGDRGRVEAALRAALGGTTARPDIDIRGRSDHAPFQDAGIAVGGIFTGIDRCYHERCDTLVNVDRAVLGVSATAAENALVALAG